MAFLWIDANLYSGTKEAHKTSNKILRLKPVPPAFSLVSHYRQKKQTVLMVSYLAV